MTLFKSVKLTKIIEIESHRPGSDRLPTDGMNKIGFTAVIDITGSKQYLQSLAGH
jgi:hypothetical protein